MGDIKGKVMVATYDDAKVFMELVRWSTELGLGDALSEIYAPDFDPSDTADQSPAVRKVLMFGETMGTLVKHDVLDWDLASDLFWIEGMWNKVGAHARAIRQREGEPKLYEHFESLAVRATQ